MCATECRCSRISATWSAGACVRAGCASATRRRRARRGARRRTRRRPAARRGAAPPRAAAATGRAGRRGAARPSRPRRRTSAAAPRGPRARPGSTPAPPRGSIAVHVVAGGGQRRGQLAVAGADLEHAGGRRRERRADVGDGVGTGIGAECSHADAVPRECVYPAGSRTTSSVPVSGGRLPLPASVYSAAKTACRSSLAGSCPVGHAGGDGAGAPEAVVMRVPVRVVAEDVGHPARGCSRPAGRRSTTTSNCTVSPKANGSPSCRRDEAARPAGWPTMTST